LERWSRIATRVHVSAGGRVLVDLRVVPGR
jgi:hypothetical protein